MASGSETNGWGLTTADGLSLGHASAQTVQMRSNTDDDGFYFSLTSDGTTAIKLQNLATPTADKDAANKAYVDTVAQGLHAKDAAYVGTQAATTSADSVAASNFVVSTSATGGIEYTQGTLTVDSTGITVAGTVILVKHNVNGSAAHQGLYSVGSLASTTCTLTRITAMDNKTEVPGAYSLVTHGTDSNKGFVVTSPDSVDTDTFTLGSTAIAWTTFSSASGALTIDGGTIDNSIIGGSTAAAGTFTTLIGTTSVGYLAADAAGSILLNTNGIVFEGAGVDAFETTLAVVDPTADRTITFPDAAGTVCTTAQADGSLANAVFGTGLSGTTDNAVTLNTNDITANQITSGETLFFAGASGNIHRIGNISAAATNTFTMDSCNAANAAYTLIVVKNDSGTYTAESFAITSTTNGGTTLSTTGDHGFTVCATKNTGFLFSSGPPITLRTITDAKLVLTGTVAASSTAIPGTLTNNTSTIQTDDYILGNNLYTLAPDAATSAVVRYAATAAAFDGSAVQTLSVNYDTTTMTIDGQGKLAVSGIQASNISGQITTATQLDQYQISGVSLGSDLNALTPGTGLTVGTEGFSVTNGQGTLTYGQYKRVFFAPSGTTLVWVATVVSVVQDGPGGVADVVTVGDFATNDITTSHHAVFLRQDANANWSFVGGGASVAISAVDDGANTFTIADASQLATLPGEIIAYIFDGNTTVDAAIYAQVTNATQTTSQIAATVTGTIPAGSTILNTQIQGATDGQPTTVATFNARTYGTFYGQAAMTLSMSFADAENIVDNSSNELLGFGVVLNATNNLKITNAANDGAPLLETEGSANTDIDMELKIKSADNATGVGTFNFTKSGAGGSVKLNINDLTDTQVRTLAFTAGAASTITFPAGDVTLATLTGTETLTAKTLSGATINSSSTIDASIIGGTTAAAGTFTTLVANTSVNVLEADAAGGLLLNSTGIIFEGATADAFETTLTAVDPTSSKTISLPTPAANDTVALLAEAQTLSAKTLSGATINSSSTIDASIIGGSTAAAGTFTTLIGTTSVGYLAADASGSILLNANGIVFEGAGVDAFETTLAVVNPTADRTITFPNAAANDTVALLAEAQTLSAKTLAAPTITGDVLMAEAASVGVPSATSLMTLEENGGDPTVTIAGKLVATGGVSSSDINLKKNVEECGGLELIREMRGVSWDWRNNSKPSMGIIAQEVQKWVPSIVSEQKNGLGVEYNGLIGILINAMNDLNQKVDLIAEGKVDDAVKVKADKAVVFDMDTEKGTKGTERKAKQQGDDSSASESESESESVSTTPVASPKVTPSRYNLRRRGRGQRKARSD